MNQKCKMIMDEYRENRHLFLLLSDLVSDMLNKAVIDADIAVMAIEHRVKTEESLAGKLELKGDKYASLDDITDILGARIICFFSDDVDKIAASIEKLFVIDWDNSVDKRKQLSPDAFGYLSLHYIASLPFDKGYPEELCGKRFEIQIRSTLQHVWAAINHDLGYKSEFGVPRMIVREFSRVAGLLEVADDQFVQIRDSVGAYSAEIRQKIADNTADEVLIDMVSLREYVRHNKQMRRFLQELASLCGDAEISEIDPESYINQLAWLGKKTIGDLQNMLEKDENLALSLAKDTLENSELDILSSNVGLRYLCRAELLLNNYNEEEITQFLLLSVGKADRAKRQAQRLMKNYEKYKSEKNV